MKGITMDTDVLELETPYVKPAQKATPPKADHKHEYFVPFCMRQIRKSDGTLSSQKYMFSGLVQCIECGHVNRNAYRTAERVEVTPKEFYDKYYRV
jgi:hypothetical protein